MMAKTNDGIIVPLFRKITQGFQKIFIPSDHIILEDNETTLQEKINEIDDGMQQHENKLNSSDWIAIGTANQITARYKYNQYMCEVEMSGTLISAGLPAWESFSIGFLPTQYAPTSTMMIPSIIPSRYMLQVTTSGEVLFVATSTFSGSNDYVKAHCMYLI